MAELSLQLIHFFWANFLFECIWGNNWQNIKLSSVFNSNFSKFEKYKIEIKRIKKIVLKKNYKYEFLENRNYADEKKIILIEKKMLRHDFVIYQCLSLFFSIFLYILSLLYSILLFEPSMFSDLCSSFELFFFKLFKKVFFCRSTGIVYDIR